MYIIDMDMCTESPCEYENVMNKCMPQIAIECRNNETCTFAQLHVFASLTFQAGMQYTLYKYNKNHHDNN